MFKTSRSLVNLTGYGLMQFCRVVLKIAPCPGQCPRFPDCHAPAQWFIEELLLYVNKAYQFSSITSVTLLDCWTIPWVMILTWFFLGTRYSLWQLFGAAICIIGLGLVFLSDAGVGGGVFYAMSNVGEILAFDGYAVSTFMFYTIAPFVLQLSGATMFNLSILTSDMWAVVIRIFFYHQQVDWLYYLSFAIVCTGLVIYSTTEKNYVPVPAIEDGNSNTQYEVLTEESEATRNESLVS
ncbi:hypothetical protein SO802_030734 [Lithocarpus litseifolius]|uniref:Uncharacterized protein n=1 Tax=Lithocarpus litseifolius TaxID=425828 RepID=A0AAW2BK45_9ROSI